MAKKTHVRRGSNHSHKHFNFIIIALGLVVAVVVYAYFSMLSQANTLKLEYQSQISKQQCKATGSPVINVTQQVTNDADSGEAGNYWALDTFSRHIQVWKQTNGSFCALVDYDGRFAAQPGQISPGNTGTLTGTEDGTIHGGYRAVINGSFLASPLLPTQGAIGPTNYQCDLSGQCPGSFDWTTKYFNTSASNFTFNFAWWGWTYRNGQHVWVNAVTGNSGDVI